MDTPQFQDSFCRSFLYRRFKLDSAKLIKLNDFTVINSLGNIQEEINCAHNASLSDISFLQRVGFKGKGVFLWLEKQGITVPHEVNFATCLEDQCVVARLGENEVLILDSLKSSTDLPKKLIHNWNQNINSLTQINNFIIPRQDSHACLALTGNKASDTLSKVCAIDLRPTKFCNYQVTQTFIARISAIIIRHDFNNILNYYLMCESSYVEYLWDCLYDAIEEYQGAVVGLSALQTLT